MTPLDGSQVVEQDDIHNGPGNVELSRALYRATTTTSIPPYRNVLSNLHRPLLSSSLPRTQLRARRAHNSKHLLHTHETCECENAMGAMAMAINLDHVIAHSQSTDPGPFDFARARLAAANC